MDVSTAPRLPGLVPAQQPGDLTLRLAAARAQAAPGADENQPPRLTATTIASVMPEIGVTAALSAGTIAAAVLLAPQRSPPRRYSPCASYGGPTFPPPSASWSEHP